MIAMILAAGLGTRLRPLTLTRPKALVEVGGKPLLWHVIDKVARAGARRIVINVHHKASQITDYLAANGNFGLDIRVSDETSSLLDTGGAVRHARELLGSEGDEPILLHNVDIVSNADLKQLYAEGMRSDATLLVSRRETSRYLLFDEEGMRLAGWTNIKTGEVKSPYADIDPSRCVRRAFSGIHVMSPRLFPLMESWPEKFSIIDFYLAACKERDIRGYEQEGLCIVDAGKAENLEQAGDLIIRYNNK